MIFAAMKLCNFLFMRMVRVGIATSLLASCASEKPLLLANKKRTQDIVAEADDYAAASKAAKYKQAISPVLKEVFRKSLDQSPPTAGQTYSLDAVVVVGLDGRVVRVIVANNPLSPRFRENVQNIVLPQPPQDQWPVRLDMRFVVRR